MGMIKDRIIEAEDDVASKPFPKAGTWLMEVSTSVLGLS